MTTPHLASRPTAPQRTTPPPADEPHPAAWIAPLTATLLLLLLGPAALFLGGISAMATDSCGPDDCPPALMDALSAIYALLSWGSLGTVVLLVLAWALPWTRRCSAARVWLSGAALLPSLAVLFLVLTLPAP